MEGHIHTGPYAVAFAGVSAILIIQLLRLLAMQMAKVGALAPVARVLGGLVTFETVK